jgi:hypothetical protein
MIIDYKKLLEKYIHYVEEADWLNFITDLDKRWETRTQFSPEEWETLTELANTEQKNNQP